MSRNTGENGGVSSKHERRDEVRYKVIDPVTSNRFMGSFQVTATPVRFGESGNKSFFIDTTSRIRFTRENREANENDEPLNR